MGTANIWKVYYMDCIQISGVHWHPVPSLKTKMESAYCCKLN